MAAATPFMPVCRAANAAGCQPPVLALGDVIGRHTRARGGAAALDAIHSMATVIWITEKGSTIEGRYKCTTDPAFRIDIYDRNKHVYCEGLDAQGPWIWPAGSASATQGVPDARRTGLEGIEFNLYGLHRLPGRGAKLTLGGRSTIGGTTYYVIQVDLKDSYRTFLYIDPDTWMIARRRDNRSFHPDLDPTKAFIETQYNDYRPVSGVMTAFLQHQVNLATGAIADVTAIRSLVYNPVIDPKTITRHYTAQG